MNAFHTHIMLRDFFKFRYNWTRIRRWFLYICYISLWEYIYISEISLNIYISVGIAIPTKLFDCLGAIRTVKCSNMIYCSSGRLFIDSSSRHVSWKNNNWSSIHTEKYFPNLIKSNRNQIVFTIFRLISNQTEHSLVTS